MRFSLCGCSAALLPPISSSKSPSPIICSVSRDFINLSWPREHLLHALTGAISFSLLFSSPSSLASDSPVLHSNGSFDSSYYSSSSELCGEADVEEMSRTAPQLVTHEGIVEEAWDIVNENFLDAGRNLWSPETWLKKKENVLSTSINTRSRAHDTIQRMLSSLGDPYTRFLSHEEFSKMARYDMTGVGINLREVTGDNGVVKLKVMGLVLDGPAHSAGVRQGDEVLSVNGVDVKGKSAFEASTLLLGPSETFVTIKVKHDYCDYIQSLKVERKLVARTPVFYRLEQVGNDNVSIGYVRLKEFNALARKDLAIAMKRLRDLGASYFVLDLRDNLGGLVQAGIETAKLFLNEGETVIYTVGRDPEHPKAVVADEAAMVTAPVIVLVNQRSASASEMVAGALHDNCKAVLIGERTFGKGLIQSVFELDDGSGVVVTVGKYVTPNHTDISGSGILPDARSFPGWDEVARQLSRCKAERDEV